MVVSPKGKEAPNGIQLWGKTLYDFYHLNRAPTNQHSITKSTGSKLAAYMREIGELDWAGPEIQWADQEKDPERVLACDIGKLVEDCERHVAMGLFGKSINQVDLQEPNSTHDVDHDKSIFHPSNYPPPWPLVPFSTHPIRLQKHIPFHLLPRKLLVHDPWNLLSCADIPEGKDSLDWTAEDDIVRTYHLQLSEASKETAEDTQDDKGNEDTTSTFLFTRDPDTPGPAPPPVMVSLPPRPPPPSVVPEAHLYISPFHRCGSGNHSIVYRAEWELPRSLLVDDVLCDVCIEEKGAEYLQQRQNMPDLHGLKSEGHLHPTTGTISFKDEFIPAAKAEIVREDAAAKESEKGKAKSMGHGETRTIEPGKTVRMGTYEGPVLQAALDVKWQNPERGQYCSHIQASRICKKVPLTAKVSVAAKLSIQHDVHLAREAENYQSFPSHLFQSWDGYNLIPPLLDPVPVNAVVPQFYGYYIPTEKQEGESRPYLSPILLLEDCGVPIDPNELNIDDKHECASLLFRLHEAGWNHGSFAPRNILVQNGPLSEWPAFRGLNDVRSIRLIDFGRSFPCTSLSRADEEMIASRLFHINGF